MGKMGIDFRETLHMIINVQNTTLAGGEDERGYKFA